MGTNEHSVTTFEAKRPHATRVGALAAVVYAVVIVACDPSRVDPTYWDRTYVDPGAEGDAQTNDGGAVSDPTKPGPCSLSIALTTLAYGGEFAPKNVGAIWVTDQDGVFVRSLETWGNKRLEHAVAWEASSSGNEVDAVTGATRKRHGAHAVTWNCLDAKGNEAPTGPYLLHVEFTEDNSAEGEPEGPHRTIPIDTTPGSAEETPADDDALRDVVVRLEP